MIVFAAFTFWMTSFAAFYLLDDLLDGFKRISIIVIQMFVFRVCLDRFQCESTLFHANQ